MQQTTSGDRDRASLQSSSLSKGTASGRIRVFGTSRRALAGTARGSR